MFCAFESGANLRRQASFCQMEWWGIPIGCRRGSSSEPTSGWCVFGLKKWNVSLVLHFQVKCVTCTWSSSETCVNYWQLYLIFKWNMSTTVHFQMEISNGTWFLTSFLSPFWPPTHNAMKCINVVHKFIVRKHIWGKDFFSDLPLCFEVRGERANQRISSETC